MAQRQAGLLLKERKHLHRAMGVDAAAHVDAVAKPMPVPPIRHLCALRATAGE